MEKILQGISRVVVNIDNILITGQSDEEKCKSLSKFWVSIEIYPMIEERQVLIFEAISGVLRLLGRQGGSSCNPWQSGSYHQSPRTSESVRTKIIPWSCELHVLCQVHSPPLNHHSTTQPCTIPEHIMEVDERVPAGISQSETTTSVLRSVSSLQSRPTAEAGLWRVSLLCWGRVVLCFLEWYWKANRLCIENPHPEWKRIHTVGKRGTLSWVWNQNVPSVSIWQTVHHSNWP